MTNEEIIIAEEIYRTQYAGRLVVRYDPILDITPMKSKSFDREIGILLEISANMSAHVFWQNTARYDWIWVGSLTFVD